MPHTINYHCLLILVASLIMSGSCQEDDHHDHDLENSEQILTTSQIWGFGFLAGLGVSLIGFLAALLLLLARKCCSDSIFGIIIKFLFSLACGALIGDSFVHILAQSYSNQALESWIISLIFIGSILLLIILEKGMESCGFSHTHWHQETHNHSNVNPNPQEEINAQSEQFPVKGKSADDAKAQISQSSGQLNQANQQELKQGEQDPEEKANCCKQYLLQYSGKGTMGYINLIGSLIHNFIDGLAVGIVFSTGHIDQIIPVFVAIIAHEIPRQLGDVAILLKNDFSATQTVVCNGTINLFSLIGVIIGLAITNLNNEVKDYIMIFVAANFVYIAADIWKNMFKNKEKAILKNLIEFGGFSLGVGAMFALTLLETEDGHGH